MAYANSILFYGWSGDDAKNVVKKLVNKNPNQNNLDKLFDNLSRDSEKYENICNEINKKLQDIDVKLSFSIFEGGLLSDISSFMCYLHFGEIKSNQSCDDDDISKETFSIKELKKFFGDSFVFNKENPGLTQPKLINLTVSDTK